MADTEIATVLPKEIRLGVPPKMPQARTYLFRQQSTLSTYQSGNTIQINIPRLQRSYLRKDSYLRFRVNGTFSQIVGGATLLSPTTGLALDTAGAYGFIEKIEVFDYLGSTVLESISGVPQLSALLLDLGLREFIDGKNANASSGLGKYYSYNGTPAVGTGGIMQSCHVQQGGDLQPPSLGMEIISPPTNLPSSEQMLYLSGQPFSREFAIPLPSFLGILSEKMVPLHNGFTIVLTLSNKHVPFVFTQPQDCSFQTEDRITTKTIDYELAQAKNVFGLFHTQKYPSDSQASSCLTWNVSDVYMNCQILELGPVAESMIMSSSQGSPLVVHTKSMRNYVSNIKGATWTTNEHSVISSADITVLDYSSADILGRTLVINSNTHGQLRLILSARNYASVGAIALDMNEQMSGDLNYRPYSVAAVGNKIKIESKSSFSIGYELTEGSGLNPEFHFADGLASTGTTNTITSTGTPEFNLNMNLNVASLTNILWIMRPSIQLDSLLYSSYGHRTRNFLQRWQFQYGSTTLPQSNGIQTMGSFLPTTPVVTKSIDKYNILSCSSAEGFNELLKARPVYLPANRFNFDNFNSDFTFHKDLDVIGDIGPAVNKSGILPTARSFYNIGRFAAGLNLQLANGKDGQIICGLNTNGMNTSIRGTFHPMYIGHMDETRVDAWAEYDAFINISPGIATTVSF